MILRHVKKGYKVGISYSGGLDTTVAINWMKTKGIKVYAYYANLENLKKKEIKEIKYKALKYGAVKFTCLNLVDKLIEESFVALKCGAFNVYNGCNKYFNTTPLGRVVIGKYIAKKIKEDNIKIWSDGSTFKGNDIERFFIYVLEENKNLNIYKPWLDDEFIKEIGGGRKQMLEFLNKRHKIHNFNKKKNYSVDSNILGNTYEGGNIENLNSSLLDIDFNMKKKTKKKKIDISICFKKGLPIKYNYKKIKNYSKFLSDLNIIGGKFFLGISDQIEDRIIGTKSRGIYESPCMYILHNAYERIVSCVHDYDSINFYRINGLILGSLLYKGRWNCKEAEMRKFSINGFSKKVSGTVCFEIRYGFMIVKNTSSNNSIYLKANSSMENEKTSFSFLDRIGYLNLIKLKI